MQVSFQFQMKQIAAKSKQNINWMRLFQIPFEFSIALSSFSKVYFEKCVCPNHLFSNYMGFVCYCVLCLSVQFNCYILQLYHYYQQQKQQLQHKKCFGFQIENFWNEISKIRQKVPTKSFVFFLLYFIHFYRNCLKWISVNATENSIWKF